MSRLDSFSKTALFGLMACLFALLACGGGGGWGRQIAPWTYRIGCTGGMGNCYDEAMRTCPYGFHVAGENNVATGAMSSTNMIGNTAFTTVRTSREGSLIVECIKPTFCTVQSDCASLGQTCVISARYPGNNVCMSIAQQ